MVVDMQVVACHTAELPCLPTWAGLSMTKEWKLDLSRENWGNRPKLPENVQFYQNDIHIQMPIQFFLGVKV